MLPRFTDPSLLERALTHTSFANEHAQEKGQPGRGAAAQDNERLEFLGDAILDFVAAAWLFRRYPDLHEGRLTSLRAALVRATTLARIADELGLPDQLRLGKGELESGGKRRANILGDAFEAVLGALFLDQGIVAVREFLEPLLDRYAAGILSENLDRDPKSLLQEWSQRELTATPRYRLVSADGPAHHRTFTVEVLLGDRVAATGSGFNKQTAEQMAAREALRLAGQAEAEPEATQDGAAARAPSEPQVAEPQVAEPGDAPPPVEPVPRVEVVPATAGRWDDLAALFGPRGAYAGCWCMFWRRRRVDSARCTAEDNRQALEALTHSDPAPGLLAYVDGQAVGWCSVGPREDFAGLEHSRVLKRVDDRPVWSIVCFFVAKPHRRTGVMAALIAGAVDYAREHGAAIVEAYPLDLDAPKLDGQRLTGSGGYMGIASAYRAAGFVEVARASDTQVIMRLEAPRPAGRDEAGPAAAF